MAASYASTPSTEGQSEAAWASTRDAQHISASDVETLTQEYEKMVEEMRAVFHSGRTKDVEWRRTQLKQIRKMIGENHEEITAAVRADLGGPKLRGVADFACAGCAEHALKNLDEWTAPQRVGGVVSQEVILAEPKGIVLNIAPWNFPFNMCLQPLVPAIAAGNCVVIKPSEMAPRSAEIIASLVERYLDRDCVKVVLGAVPETSALLNQRWDHIIYTGNGAIGRVVMAAAAKHLTPVTLELGGKSPVIIDETAQMDAVCSRVSVIKWLNQGQICVAPDYVLIHESRAKEFTERMKDMVVSAYGKDPKTSSDWGYVINERHVDRVANLVRTSGGEIVCGGTDTIDKQKRYFPPTLITDPKLDSPIMQEEIFGPVLPIISYKNLDDAIGIVNSKETPLSLYVYSEDQKNIEKVLQGTKSGGGCVNSSLEHLLSHNMPFGGQGASGMGSYHGKFGFDEFSHKRAMLYKTTLPGMRGPFIPLPNAGRPVPNFVYDLAVKAQVTGFVPEEVKKVLKFSAAALVLGAAAKYRSRL